MTNKDLISQYVDTGMGIPEYQFNKLSSNDKGTYLRKIGISIKHNPNNIQYYYGESQEEAQLEMVKENGKAILYILENGIKPSEAVQLAAVNDYPSAIGYIYNPSEAVKLAAVKKDWVVLYDIDNPSEEVQLAGVRQHAIALTYIINPTDRVKELHKQLWGN